MNIKTCQQVKDANKCHDAKWKTQTNVFCPKTCEAGCGAPNTYEPTKMPTTKPPTMSGKPSSNTTATSAPTTAKTSAPTQICQDDDTGLAEASVFGGPQTCAEAKQQKYCTTQVSRGEATKFCPLTCKLGCGAPTTSSPTLGGR